MALWPRPAAPLPAPEVARIWQTVRSANQTEFDLYASASRLDPNWLNRWFTRLGTARAMVVGGLNRAIRNGRRLRLPPSSYVLVDISVNATDTRVKTNEQWYLLWCDECTNKDIVLFDTLNRHQYWLKKRGVTGVSTWTNTGAAQKNNSIVRPVVSYFCGYEHTF